MTNIINILSLYCQKSIFYNWPHRRCINLVKLNFQFSSIPVPSCFRSGKKVLFNSLMNPCWPQKIKLSILRIEEINVLYRIKE